MHCEIKNVAVERLVLVEVSVIMLVIVSVSVDAPKILLKISAIWLK